MDGKKGGGGAVDYCELGYIYLCGCAWVVLRCFVDVVLVVGRLSASA